MANKSKNDALKNLTAVFRKLGAEAQIVGLLAD